jgi:hypothetical protein
VLDVQCPILPIDDLTRWDLVKAVHDYDAQDEDLCLVEVLFWILIPRGYVLHL